MIVTPGRKTFSLKGLKNRATLVKDLWFKRPVVRGLPTILYIESTNRCNLECKMCPRRLMSRPQIDMSLELFEGVIGQLDARRTELVVLHSDGEPLLNPHIFAMIRSAKSRGLQVMTSTNATLLDEAAAREFFDSGLDVLTLSIDGITPDVYEFIRKGANFQQVIENIKRFLEMKKAGKPFTILQMIKMKENEHQTDDFLRYWQPYKNKNTHAVVKPMTDWFEEHPGIIDRLKFCDRPWFGMVVQSSGNVVPCVHDFNGVEVLGRLPEENIYDIWNSQGMVNLRKGILKGRRENKLCKNCNATPPRGFGLRTALGLTVLDMKTVAKTLAIIGYNRPKQY